MEDFNCAFITSYERDNETELDFAEARMYSYGYGRFTSPDPLMASAQRINPQTFNRYNYALNNPLRLVDPSGLAPCPPDDPDCIDDTGGEPIVVEAPYDPKTSVSCSIVTCSSGLNEFVAPGLLRNVPQIAPQPVVAPQPAVNPFAAPSIASSAARVALLPLVLPAAVIIMASARTTQAPGPATTTTTKTDEEERLNRGRIQIQGSNPPLEVSAPWSQSTPPTKAQGVVMLNGLWNSLSRSEQKDRKAAYQQALRFINGLPPTGSLPTSRTFQDPQRKDSRARIDIEIITGTAFID